MSRGGVCKVPGCGRPVRARGMCQTHDKQHRESGRVSEIPRRRPARKGRVRLKTGHTVTPECVAVLDRVAAERGQSQSQLVTDVVEKWVQRRSRGRKRK